MGPSRRTAGRSKTRLLRRAGLLLSARGITMAAAHRAWAKSEGFKLADAPATDHGVQLSVSAPENNTHVWRNPEVPAALKPIALKAVVDPPAPQIIWYVDRRALCHHRSR